MLGLGYKYKQEVSNKPCDWNIECKRRKLINKYQTGSEVCVFSATEPLPIYDFTYKFGRLVRFNILSGMVFTCKFQVFSPKKF